ncbi:unnamed protein product [Urochloa humidicola]
MADSYRMSMHDELEDIHRLLPREILEDIGIIVFDPAEKQALDVAEVLAAHLASVLGVAPPKKASYHHHPQANVVGHASGRGMDAALAGKVSAPGVVAVPPFLPSPPAAPWQVMDGLRRKAMALHPMDTMPGFAPARPLLAGGARPPMACRGVGTGVFLPRRSRCTEVVRRTAKAPARRLPPSNSDYARMVEQRLQQASSSSRRPW